MLAMSGRTLAMRTAGFGHDAAGQPAAAEGSAEGAAFPARPAGSLWRWRPSWVAVAALLTGLIVTGALVLTSVAVYNRNERRLLNLRVRELSLVLAATAPSIQTPLASAAELADATGGNAQKFRAFMAPYVGPGRQFTSVSLWPLGTSHLAPSTVLGSAPALASMPERAARFFRDSTRPGVLNLTSFLSSPRPALGFDFSAPGRAHGFAVYAENPLPANRRSKLERNSAFSDLNYALYLGRSKRTSDVLVTSLEHLPIEGRQAADVVPFGAGVFTIVVSPNGSLGGAFFQRLPWIIALVGLFVSLAAALMTDRLARRRRRAEQLADVLDRVAAENREMYTEQRSIAQTLQHALLPDTLPAFDGLQVGARYVPAASGIDVGGDWYDVVAAGAGRVLVMIGDVSGHGLRAATTMASLRHAALAYAAQDPGPSAVLAQLSDFVNSGPHDYFATMLCALLDVRAQRLTVAGAGHLPPLLIDGDGGRFVELDANVPIGVARSSPYVQRTLSVGPDTTLIAFTDGLVERRGEVLDVGLARLREAATGVALALEDLLSELAQGLASEGHHDDTAIVGIRW
jgi:serine phosphatase RsbU (regulator of sigma subunit)